jgi:hypothetical protein
LLDYVESYPTDSLYNGIEALGALQYEPARSFLEELVRMAKGQRQEIARFALRSLDRPRCAAER